MLTSYLCIESAYRWCRCAAEPASTGCLCLIKASVGSHIAHIFLSPEIYSVSFSRIHSSKSHICYYKFIILIWKTRCYHQPYRQQICTLYGIGKRKRSHLSSTTVMSVHTQILRHKKTFNNNKNFQIKHKKECDIHRLRQRIIIHISCGF